MPTLYSRLVNMRFCGPIESYKVNQIKNTITRDIAVLEKHTQQLCTKVKQIENLIIPGEYINAGKAHPVP